MRTSGQVTVHVEAPPEAVYDLVADVTRIGEFSPSAGGPNGRRRPTGGPRLPVPGPERRNKLSRCSRTCGVLTANAGREFSFRTVPAPTKPDSTVWCYRFQPAGDSTDVTESYEVVKRRLGRCSPSSGACSRTTWTCARTCAGRSRRSSGQQKPERPWRTRRIRPT
jgi:hypothetical protein